MNNSFNTTIKTMNQQKKDKIFQIILENKQPYTINSSGIFIDYLKLNEQTQMQIRKIVEKEAKIIHFD
jgi:hypothetical protein